LRFGFSGYKIFRALTQRGKGGVYQAVDLSTDSPRLRVITRFSDRLKVRFDIENDVLRAVVPHLILQPIVENSIKHAIGKRNANGIIEIKAGKVEDNLLLQVKDNGPGISPKMEDIKEDEKTFSCRSAYFSARFTAKQAAKSKFQNSARQTLIGDGANRLELYPIRTETGERMMMVYLPEHKLLYASDLVQKSLNGSFFMPQYLSEVMQAAKREKIDVGNVFAFHTDLTPWAELTNAVEKQIKGN